MKETKAAILKIDNGLSTGEKEAMELTGTDFEANHRTLVDEYEMRKTAGLISSGFEDDGEDDEVEGGEE